MSRPTKEFKVKHDRWPRPRGFTEKELREALGRMRPESIESTLRRLRAKPLVWERLVFFHVAVMCQW